MDLLACCTPRMLESQIFSDRAARVDASFFGNLSAIKACIELTRTLVVCYLEYPLASFSTRFTVRLLYAGSSRTSS
jgi:hypothetical protein